MKQLNLCPRCGEPLLMKFSSLGLRYVQCADTKKCQFISDADDEGNPVTPPATGVVCERCGCPVTISLRGSFLTCTAFPKCRKVKSITAGLRERLKGVLPAAAKPPAPDATRVEISRSASATGASRRRAGTTRLNRSGEAGSGESIGGRQARLVFSYGEHDSSTAFDRGAEQDFIRELQAREWENEGPTGGDLSEHCDPDVKSIADLVSVVTKNMVEEAKLPPDVVRIPFDKLSALMNEGGWVFVGGAFEEFESHNTDTEITVVLATGGFAEPPYAPSDLNKR